MRQDGMSGSLGRIFSVKQKMKEDWKSGTKVHVELWPLMGI